MSSEDGFEAWWASVVKLVRAQAVEGRADPLHAKGRAFRELAEAVHALHSGGYRIAIEDECADEPRITIHRKIPIEMTPPSAEGSPSSKEQPPDQHVFVSLVAGTRGSRGG